MNNRFIKKKKQKSNFKINFFYNYEKNFSNNNPIELHRAIFSPISISFAIEDAQTFSKTKKNSFEKGITKSKNLHQSQ